MDDAPPPTAHVLRPHHVGLLTIFMLIFKEPDAMKIPSDFLLHLYRVLLTEVSEVSITCTIVFVLTRQERLLIRDPIKNSWKV